MVNFFFDFKVLPSRELCFSKCFCSIFFRSFSQLLSNFDLFNSSILTSNVTRSALFLTLDSSSKIFAFQVQRVVLINLIFRWETNLYISLPSICWSVGESVSPPVRLSVRLSFCLYLHTISQEPYII